MSTGEVSEHPNVARVRSLQSDYLAQFVHSPPGEGLGVVYASVNRVNGMIIVPPPGNVLGIVPHSVYT